MTDSKPNELDEFLEWAKAPRGHYTVAQLVENFRRYKAQRTENEKAALRQKVAGDE